MEKINKNWVDDDDDREDDQYDLEAFHYDDEPLDDNSGIPRVVMESVLDQDDDDDGAHARPAKGGNFQGDIGPLKGLLSGLRDDISVISSNWSLIETRLEKLEELIKGRDNISQTDKYIKHVSKMLNETRLSFHNDMALFNKDSYKAIFDGLDQKMRILHEEGRDRKAVLEDMADTVSAANIKWIVVYSGIFSGLWTILMAICLTIMK